MPVLHEHPSPSSLVPLLQSHLPTSLPTLSTLVTPGNPLKVYTTFPTSHEPSTAEPGPELPWIVLIDAGNQFRFFCSQTPTETTSNDDGTKAEELLYEVLGQVMDQASREKRDIVRIGAIHDRWTRVVERVTGVECMSASRIWCDPAYFGDHKPATTTSSEEELRLPEGFEIREAEEEDVPIILSTSEVPHLPSYLLTRLSHTSCIFRRSSSNSSSSDAELVAHVTTHRDGSLGTLYVNPSCRRLGLARLVLQHRLSKMRKEARDSKLGFCYVHRENEASRAVMKSLGWRESEENVWWNIVDVQEWVNRQKLRN
ncbi:GNAT family N-acetyltransferase [Sporobolomyces salmoneus]|uniref:GNAT family N-acetyltransferase n=1 Tax=Sporobolomyces salmoneus TaxID=183962 RepID=UPI00316C9590